MGAQIFQSSKNTISTANISHDASGLPSSKTISESYSSLLNTFGKKVDSTASARGSHLNTISFPAEWGRFVRRLV